MARDPRKHQKRQERRNRREKEKRKERSRALSISFSPISLVEAAGNPPFVFCGINRIAFTEGIGNLLVARALPNGQCVMVLFLVDLYCLGIKDVVIEMVPRSKLERQVVPDIFRNEPAESLSPAEALKLVVGAFEFAARYGLYPRGDFERGLGIFLGVDKAEAQREFEFGKDGKPLYINGPYDSLAFQNRILNTLERTAGRQGYEHVNIAGDLDDFDDFDDGEIIEVDGQVIEDK